MEQSSRNPNVLDSAVPLYDDDLYEHDTQTSHRLGDVLERFQEAVELIEKLVAAMKDDDYAKDTSETLLDHFYGCDWSDPHYPPHQNDNYYYVLSMPELRNLEYALETLPTGKDLQSVRRQTDQLKQRLWIALPDFYRGHANPFPAPRNYRPDKPYPALCVMGSLLEDRKYQAYQRKFGMYDYREKLAALHQVDDAPLSQVSFEEGNFALNGNTFPTDIYWTEMHPFIDMMCFVADVTSYQDPAFLSIDPEGPPTVLVTQRAASFENVKLVVELTASGYARTSPDTVSGVVNRHQLADCFMDACQEAINNRRSFARELEQKNSEYSPGYAASERSYAQEWSECLTRVKALL